VIGWRKVSFGILAYTLAWAAFMWAPAISEASRKEILILQGTIVTLVIGANSYVHRQKLKASNSGAGQTPPPVSPGTTPAAETEATDSPDGAPSEMEKDQ
jgi:hypothetical protein